MKPWLWIAGVALWAAASAGAQGHAPLQTIPGLDVSRYLGRWHEIAKFPNRFQKHCASDTSADYTLRPDGSIGVLNQCRRADGEWEKALGQARQIGGSGSARLQVRFAPAWLSFLPMVWGDYWIIDLDPEYRWAVVGHPSRKYLWILSRTPHPPKEKVEALVERARGLGFATDRLIWVSQDPAGNAP